MFKAIGRGDHTRGAGFTRISLAFSFLRRRMQRQSQQLSHKLCLACDPEL